MGGQEFLNQNVREGQHFLLENNTNIPQPSPTQEKRYRPLQVSDLNNFKLDTCNMTAGPFVCQSIVHLDGFFFTVFILLVQPFEQ